MTQKNAQFILLLACSIFALGLIGLVLLGWQSRYMQDDYCFDFLLQQKGFFAAQWHTYFEETAFNGNRYSANLVMGLSALVGTISAQLMPIFILITLFSSVCFFLSQINPYLENPLPRWAQLLMALSFIFLTYTLTPNRFQSLFWRPASVTYSLPLAFLALLGGAVLHFARKPAFKPVHAAVLFILSLVAGGFAEHATVLACSALAVALLLVVMNKYRSPQFTRIYKSLFAALAGAGTALLLMVVSPAARLRQALLFPAPPSLPDGLAIAISAFKDFILRALYRLPMHTLWTLLLFAFLGLSLQSVKDTTERNYKDTLLRLGLIALLGLGLLFCLCLPGALATSAPPEERAQVLLSTVWVVMLSALGFHIGRCLRTVSLAHLALNGLAGLALGLCLLVPAALPFSPAYPEIRTWMAAQPALAVGLVLLVVLAVVLARRFASRRLTVQVSCSLVHWAFLASALMAALPGLLDIYTELPARRQRAVLWDWRETQITTAIARGQTELTLPALDSIAGVLELQENADHWVNNCAELFYGLDALRVEQPVLTRIPAGE